MTEEKSQKQWTYEKAQELGLCAETVRKMLKAGEFPKARVRRVNARVIFVSEG